ncbi:MAG: TonB-dependent receptor [Pseudomonadota bacterium]
MLPFLCFAHEDETEQILVTGRAQNLIGKTVSASAGLVGKSDLATRPMLRSGELLEVIPGSAVTQHSGTGKANQYFLRGFNLDHGTDFAGFLDGVPLNLPSHGHGQGYLDLNPIIVELVDSVGFGKGPYYADIGDFSSAGYARYTLSSTVDQPLVKFTGGENGFFRGVAAGSINLDGNYLTGAFEAQRYDGPWVRDEDGEKLNALLKYSGHAADRFFGLTITAYDAEWNSTDQIPERAIRQGVIPRLGTIDQTLGGNSSRYSANLEFSTDKENARYRSNAYAVYSDFALFSNFTYFLDDPINGDQITQIDRRWILGANSTYEHDHQFFDRESTTKVGLQVRHDIINDVGLFRSRGRAPLSAVRDDSVEETNLGIFLTNELVWSTWLRSNIGVRANNFWFDVESDLAANSGTESDFVVSPKASLIFGPWADSEIYLNFGMAFHSNDARGAVSVIDPSNGDRISPVDPIVESRGYEIGFRTTRLAGLQSTLAIWYLELDSELVFVGDAGTTEASGKSERYGVEWNNFYRVNDWLTLDFDLALTKPEFTNGDEIPGSVGRVSTGGASIDLPNGIFGAFRVRHFGDTPLTESGSVKAESTTVANLRLGYRWRKVLSLSVDVFNLFDSEDPDVSYFFESCLPSDPQALCGANNAERIGVSDVHFHPLEPRQTRVTLEWRF